MSEYRTRTVRVPLDATVTVPGRRGDGWRVEVPGVYANGATEKAAVDSAVGAISRFIVEWQAPHTSMFREHAAVVYPAPADSDHVVWCEETFAPGHSSCVSSTGAISQEDAIARARYNLAQRTTDWQDDTSVHDAADYLVGGSAYGYGPANLYQYAAWQRAARAALDANRDDYHVWATGHAHEYTVPARTSVSVGE